MQSVGKRSKNQKILRVISIIDIIEAVLMIIFGVMALMGGAFIGGADPASVAELTAETGMAQGEIGSMVAGIGVSIFAGAVLSIIISIFGLRAANDINKIMPAWVFSILGLIGSCASIVMAVVRGNLGENLVSLIASLVLAVITFWVCNNIKAEAGK